LTVSVFNQQRVADQELSSCWFTQQCAPVTAVSRWIFKEYWNSSVVSWSLHFQKHHPKENNVFIRLLMCSQVV